MHVQALALEVALVRIGGHCSSVLRRFGDGCQARVGDRAVLGVLQCNASESSKFSNILRAAARTLFAGVVGIEPAGVLAALTLLELSRESGTSGISAGTAT